MNSYAKLNLAQDDELLFKASLTKLALHQKLFSLPDLTDFLVVAIVGGVGFVDPALAVLVLVQPDAGVAVGMSLLEPVHLVHVVGGDDIRHEGLRHLSLAHIVSGERDRAFIRLIVSCQKTLYSLETVSSCTTKPNR